MGVADAGRERETEWLLRQRLEDVEEALRRIVVVLQPDGLHAVTTREMAALAVAHDALELDLPEFDWLAVLGYAE